jgi:hypothetical protein
MNNLRFLKGRRDERIVARRQWNLVPILEATG